MLRVVNLRNYSLEKNEVLIKVDRSSPLGNPFFMANESMRDEVCDKYEVYMQDIISEYKNNGVIGKEKVNYVIEFNRIIHLVRQGKNVALGCWCFPKRCHALSIKNEIESILR